MGKLSFSVAGMCKRMCSRVWVRRFNDISPSSRRPGFCHVVLTKTSLFRAHAPLVLFYGFAGWIQNTVWANTSRRRTIAILVERRKHLASCNSSETFSIPSWIPILYWRNAWIGKSSAREQLITSSISYYFIHENTWISRHNLRMLI